MFAEHCVRTIKADGLLLVWLNLLHVLEIIGSVAKVQGYRRSTWIWQCSVNRKVFWSGSNRTKETKSDFLLRKRKRLWRSQAWSAVRLHTPTGMLVDEDGQRSYISSKRWPVCWKTMQAGFDLCRKTSRGQMPDLDLAPKASWRSLTFRKWEFLFLKVSWSRVFLSYVEVLRHMWFVLQFNEPIWVLNCDDGLHRTRLSSCHWRFAMTTTLWRRGSSRQRGRGTSLRKRLRRN